MKTLFKLIFSLFTALVVGVYWCHYGPQNFLWLSDMGLFLTLSALWLESPLLISIASAGIMPLEILWIFDFVTHIFTGSSPVGLTGYMFDPNLPLYLRSISLFHLILVPTWITLLAQWGYDSRGWKYATILCTLIFIATYNLEHPFENINLIFTPSFDNLTWISPREWFIGQVIILPLFVFWPMHKILGWCFTSPARVKL